MSLFIALILLHHAGMLTFPIGLLAAAMYLLEAFATWTLIRGMRR